MTPFPGKRAALGALLALAGCHTNDFIVVKLEAATGLPPIAQLTLVASDAASSSTATEPAAPVAAGLVFPTTYVIAVPHSGAVNVLASGLDANGNVIARGGTSAVASGSVQAVVVTLTANCQSPLDCDPAGVCSGSVTCGDAGSCVPSNGAVVADATGCGEDGGHCYSGACLLTVCGDGTVEVGEQCDLGAANSNSGECTLACQLARCGDGYTNQDPLPDGGFFQELCDWGADGGILSDGGNSDVLPNHCRDDCLPARCGDGVIDTGERCDLGPAWPDGGGGNGTGNGCNATCTLLEQVTLLGGTGVPCGSAVGCQGLVDGPGAQSEFFFPRGVTVAGGVAYIADEFNNVIRSLDLSSDVVATVAGSGAHETVNGTGDGGAFYSPLGVVAFQDQLAVAETSDVRLVTFAGQATTLTGTGSGHTGYANGPFASATFGQVMGLGGIATDGQNLFVTDPPNIRFLDFDAGMVSTVQAPDGGVNDLNAPSGIVYLGTLLYTTDQQSAVIESVDPVSGAVTLIAGSPGGGSLVDGTGSQAVFNVPTGICTDGQSLYVADTGNAAIRQVDPATGQVTTVAGNGTPSVQLGTGRQAGFDAPAGCAYDPLSGDLVVTDQQANEILRVH
jgi:hypothetical protein